MKFILKNNISTVFLVLLLLVMAFCFDESMFEAGITYTNISVFYISSNITIMLFLISIIAFVFIVLKRKVKFNNICILLLIRIPLYFIPIFYVNGSFKIGVAYSIVQCLLSFVIGLQNNKEDTFYIVKNALIIFTLIIGIQVFITIANYNLNFFSDDLKWYMTIPLGKSNYITCMLLPCFYFVDIYFCKTRKFLKSILYSLFVFFVTLGTGSKWGLVLLTGFIIFKFMYYAISNLKKNFFVITVSLAVILFGFMFLSDTISPFLDKIIDKFNGDIFYAREQVYIESFSLIGENPLFGRSAYYYFIYDASKAHNFILESLIQTGFIGTLIYLSCIIIVIYNFTRIKNDLFKLCFIVFIVGFLIQGLGEPNLFGAESDALFWVMIGLGVSYSSNGEKNLVLF